MNRRALLQLLSGLAILPMMPGTTLASTSQRRIILLELSGANDGLNTVVPFNDDRYHELRPSIGLSKRSVIQLDDTLGFHSALKKLMPLWEKGEMAVVHGLGYPQPNRSHFKSIALWETGGDGYKKSRNGWVTHDIEHAYATANVDAHGITLGGGMGIFSSPQGNWLSMNTANQFSGRRMDTPAVESRTNNATMRTLLELSLIHISEPTRPY